MRGIVLLRLIQAVALSYNLWIGFRVMHEWGGLTFAIIGTIGFAISLVALPVAMFFFPSHTAGPISLWPGLLIFGWAQERIDKINQKNALKSNND